MAKYTTADIIPFSDFADLLDRVTTSPRVPDRVSKLSKYIEKFRGKYKEIHGTLNAGEVTNGDSIFSIIRLLLPTQDRTRAAYNIKATALGKMFAKTIGLDVDSTEGMKLIGFKDPGKAGNAAGDLATIIYTILEKRFTSNNVPATKGPKGPTLGELHKMLDQLSWTKEGETTQAKQIKILQGFVRNLSAKEGKWLTKIILKDMMLNVPQKQILNLIHPQANDCLATTSLEQVCLKLNDPTVVLSQSEGGVKLFSYFRPMLCLRLNNLDDSDNVPNSSKKQGRGSPRVKEEAALPTPPFIVETKWDGERFQIHYKFDASTGEHIFKYFSRKGFDFTPNFDITLTPRLKAQLMTDPLPESFILDGEMMAWQKDRNMFTQKGGNIDVKKINLENVNHCPTFVAFDIVYYNGEVLISKPLTERMQILKQIFHPKDSVCQLSEQKIANSKKAVTDALNEAIDNMEEGLVVKSVDSLYEPGQRISTWLKIKPEYIEGSSVSDLDLLIMGAYYTDSVRRGGKVTHLLAGLVQNNEFYPLVKLGSGRLDRDEMRMLIQELEPHLVKTEVSSVKFGGKKKPDLFINPKKSIVVEVKATEIIYSKDYEISYTLRFARITKVRRDKSWEDALSVKDFHQLRESYGGGKLAKRTDGLARSPVQSKYKTTKRQFSESDSDHGVPGTSSGARKVVKSSPKKPGSPYQAKVDLTNVLLKKKVSAQSSIFKSCVFNIVGMIVWKEEMESRLRSHGAEIVQNPTNDSLCIVAEKISQRVQNIIKDGRYDIVKESWVEQCISTKQILPFRPEFMFFTKEETQKAFQDDYDELGDSYTFKSSLPELKTFINKIIEKDIKDEKPPSEKEMRAIQCHVDEEVFPNDHKFKKWSFLSECKIAFRGEVDMGLVAQIQFYGGVIVENEMDGGITHVILGESFSPIMKQHLSAFVVKRKWLYECLEKKEMVSEMPYTVE